MLTQERNIQSRALQCARNAETGVSFGIAMDLAN